MTLTQAIRALSFGALAMVLAQCGGSSDGPNGPPALTNSIVFVSNRSGVDEIYAMNADGTGARIIPTTSGQKSFPVPSPDGRKIAFTLGPMLSGGTSSLYVVNVDGTELTRLTAEVGLDFSPTWAPNSREIAFVSSRDDNDEIYVMNADGTNQVNVTNDYSNDTHPSWSPSGNRILFQSDRLGVANIYSMTPSGASVTLVAAGASPQWSPSGTRFLYNLFGQIWIASAPGTGNSSTQITTHSGPYFGASWSSDESKILYADAPVDAEELWTMSATDGSGAVQITPDSLGDSFYPSWTRH
jgi:Tol biopolymer transport system component